VFLPAEVAQAERRAREAATAFVAARPKSRAVGESADLSLSQVRARERRSGEPKLVIAGVIHNRSDRVSVQPAVRVTITDALGYMSIDRLVRAQVRIPPQGQQPFDVNIKLPDRLVAHTDVRLAC
jgi:hypothetical protein